MLNHQEIIEKLTIEQKLSLLADVSALGGEDAEKYGIRFVSESSVEALNAEAGHKFPSFGAMANSWNESLLVRTSDALARQAKEKGITLLNTPTANVKTVPYSDGVAEDPYLAGTLAGAVLGTGERCGIKTCLSAPEFTQTDADYSDVFYNERAVKEFFESSVATALSHGGCAIATSKSNVTGVYKNVNEKWLEQFGQKHPIIYHCKSAKETMPLLLEKDKLCKGGSYALLKEAVEKYADLQKAFESGGVSLGEIEAECACGNAISPEMVDEAVDRILDFTSACLKVRSNGKESLEEEKLALKAAEESIVLLKNTDKVLPIKKRKKVALIGAHACAGDGEGVVSFTQYASALAKAKRMQYVGFAKGYDLDSDRSPKELLDEAKKLATLADVVVLVLGYNEKSRLRAQRNKTLKLPANQLALVETLVKTGKKIVAVVCGEVYPDMRFDEGCKGVLFAPNNGSKCAAALFNVLQGITSPSGKLAVSCYNDTDEYFQTLRNYKNAGRNKVGTFYGYRHYDSSGLSAKYPFGYGLSYNKFTYSKLKRTKNGFKFKVKNNGKRTAAAVAQIYVGKVASSVIRPKKELKAFFKVFLRPGKSKTIEFKLEDLNLQVWDEAQKKFVQEGGMYSVYLCSSSKEIHSVAKVLSGYTKISKTGEKYSDYLQTYSNIHNNEYTLEVPTRRKLKKGTFRKLMILASIFMVCVDVVYGYLNYVRWLPKHWIIYATIGVVNAIPMGLALLLTLLHNKSIKKDWVKSMKQKQKKREGLNVEELADEVPYEELFESEFTNMLTSQGEELAEEEVKEEKTVLEVPFDREFPISLACEEFATFAYERGVKLDAGSIRKLFSSLASSRLLVLRSNDEEKLGALLPILGEYFGAPTAIDSHLGIEAEEDSLLYAKGEDGETTLSNAGQVFIDHSAEANRIRIISLKDIKSDGLRTCLTPVIRHVDQPTRGTQVPVKVNETGKAELYALSESLWFVVVLADGEKVTDIPKYILDMASVLELNLQQGKKVKTRPMVVKKPVKEEAPVEAEVVLEDGEQEASEKTETAVKTEEPVTPSEDAEAVTAEETAVSAEDGDVEVVEVVVEEEKTPVKLMIYSQFKKLVEYASRDHQLDEVLWKRIDKLEEYVAGCNEYHIENKLWQRMEKYVSVYLAAGGEAEEVLDCVVAQHLVYSMLPCVANSKKELDEKFAHTVENIFGEGHVPHSVKAIRETGLGV